ncbi:hypothetical protein BV25DRAFT_1995953 [Artomyces pyxidatus]|uniref:Uncharacterized protein n=1 Tax=Artomyces pyxidatus TaxID=48021 RepID=A0ACB8SH79_9AGAM|nr:hypothetical protein BV25DRAFT_1995953 [Artomyces pyxidatus]
MSTSAGSAHFGDNLSDRARKRQRMDENKEADPAMIIVRSEELWVKDGNIVVRTTSSSTSPPTQTLYKVHRHTLALHCSVFASLFDGPLDALDAGSEREGDVPIMDFPDAADDVRDFLKALYLPSEMHRHRTLLSPFREGDGHCALFPDSYCGILRLATKYEATLIRGIVVDALEKEWPTQMEHWGLLQDRMHEKMGELMFSGLDATPFWPNPVRAIRLASEYNVPNVLPIAYYDLMRVLNIEEDSDLSDITATRSRDTSDLTAEELRRVIRGRSRIHTAFRSKTTAESLVPTCRSRREGNVCGAGISQWRKSRIVELYHLEYDPFLWLELTLKKRGTGTANANIEACDGCVTSMRTHLRNVKDELWTSLPTFFGVEDVVPKNWGERE